jgi:diguanylate cyclase (GGDEF)-like protein
MEKNKVDEALRFPKAREFEKDLSLMAENGMEVVVAMTDLDGFLRVNEEYGSDEGDRVLVETGMYLRNSLPEGARLYRYGGDQFAAIFPEGMEKEEVFLKMEALRAGFSVSLPDGSRQSVTIGIAAAPDDGVTPTEIARRAEGAMFRGKAAGHDRVCLAREEKMVTKTSHYTVEQLKRLTKVSKREGIGEAVLLREALDALFKKYDA